jgi:hypothetical protein
MQDAYNDFKCDFAKYHPAWSHLSGWVRTYIYEARLLGLKPNHTAVWIAAVAAKLLHS